MHPSTTQTSKHTRPTGQDVWRGMAEVATHLVIAQLDAFSARLANALLALSEHSADSRQANLSFHAGQSLKKNTYAFFHLAALELEHGLRAEITRLLAPVEAAVDLEDADFCLVSYAEMDKKLALGRVSRSLELDCAQQYAALTMRLSHVLERETLSIAHNPFRPDVFLNLLYLAWCKFDTETDSHDLILPLLRSDILFDLEPIIEALNGYLVEQGILPDLQQSYRIHRSRSTTPAPDADPSSVTEHSSAARPIGTAQRQILRNFLAAGTDAAAGTAALHEAGTAQLPAALLQRLNEFQRSVKLTHMLNEADQVLRLSQVQEQLAEHMGTGVEKHSLDLLSQVFEHVLQNPSMPAAVKQLISSLQVPVLKAALIDQEFFFNEHHPARRLIELLSRYSPAVAHAGARQEPLYTAMQRNVARVAQEFDQEVSLFDEVVNDLEAFIAEQEKAHVAALEVPIQKALRKEKIKQANLIATQEVALRVGSGEVVAFIETFLENRWTKVLTLAYSVKEEKPHAVTDAIKTMDELIWSVKPKISLAQRQELLQRLPAILARLNKWLSLIKWEDADRIRFFAELAECHASIVRAPLDLTPERQLELAMEAAQHAAERRLERRVQEEQAALGVPVVEADQWPELVQRLERGVWLAFSITAEAPALKLRLAWVSPMRSLYILTASEKGKSFSVPAQELEQAFRQQRASILQLDQLIDRALVVAAEELA
ncbi:MULTISPECIES: DUF1631 family protein [unclassified Undibacterium]|uniref:DUF1631 family protein n=1 Tax=unclassified Undibacterium TaxID=2630295 RepID=UPI002AC8D821|nr:MULTISPECIES: DUF1631 family protein [unclassified Undibacterium]MEB0138673.1 DUF1631 family protein [Undibacterium sp. CCC2.1]MEB0171474.1 DUF1631 family protein [Undibacterium sp. CCC1.1]MEB0177988.1 DUF1631 family protein [Undibacterium sp. CCC3.4]MEB0214367.1 DUF1631 family protein [Undibacterium sp. 5I2]WPX44237.1 DUF1631 family protein [Undibacterium sp. CCC3.4]